MDKQNSLDTVSRKAVIEQIRYLIATTDNEMADWAYHQVLKELDSIRSSESEGEAETRIKELEEENRILRSLAKQREKSRDECLDHALQKEREIAVITADNEQLHVALKDIHYQIQQSNHPAGLGILAAINQVLSTTSETAVQAQSLTGEKGKET